MYALRPSKNSHVRLLGSGAILPEVIHAADLLKKDWRIDAEVFSVTSFVELAREARAVERDKLFAAPTQERASFVASLLPGTTPVIAATDYVRALPQLIAPYIDARLVALGTDGFGRSDNRAALRDFFEVNRSYIVLAALGALAEAGEIDRSTVRQAVELYDLKIKPVPAWLL